MMMVVVVLIEVRRRARCRHLMLADSVELLLRLTASMLLMMMRQLSMHRG